MKQCEVIEIFIPKIWQKLNRNVNSLKKNTKLSITKFPNLKKKSTKKKNNLLKNIRNILKKITKFKNKKKF